jgi:hypothetical protein
LGRRADSIRRYTVGRVPDLDYPGLSFRRFNVGRVHVSLTLLPEEKEPKEEAAAAGDENVDRSAKDQINTNLIGPDMGRETLDAEQREMSDTAKKCDLIFASFFATKPGGFDRKKGERCNGCHEAPMVGRCRLINSVYRHGIRRRGCVQRIATPPCVMFCHYTTCCSVESA